LRNPADSVDFAFSVMPTKKPNSKTRQCVAKRFKLTAKGKIRRRRMGRNHKFTNKSRERKNRAAKGDYVEKQDREKVLANMPYA
jgi:large subunit ribosomal protein L35